MNAIDFIFPGILCQHRAQDIRTKYEQLWR